MGLVMVTNGRIRRALLSGRLFRPPPPGLIRASSMTETVPSDSRVFGSTEGIPAGHHNVALENEIIVREMLFSFTYGMENEIKIPGYGEMGIIRQILRRLHGQLRGRDRHDQ